MKNKELIEYRSKNGLSLMPEEGSNPEEELTNSQTKEDEEFDPENVFYDPTFYSRIPFWDHRAKDYVIPDTFLNLKDSYETLSLEMIEKVRLLAKHVLEQDRIKHRDFIETLCARYEADQSQFEDDLKILEERLKEITEEKEIYYSLFKRTRFKEVKNEK